MTDQEWFVYVQELADKYSNCKKRHVGCVIVDEDTQTVAGIGWNYHVTGFCDCFTGASTALHAEAEAIEDIDEEAEKKNLVAYITHRPCDSCAGRLNSVVKDIRVMELSQCFLTGQKGIKNEQSGYQACATPPEEKNSLNELLEERGKTHGDFSEASKFVQHVKGRARRAPNWGEMTPAEREAVDMIIHKLGRWLYGSSFKDHPRDIAGYARLAEREIQDGD